MWKGDAVGYCALHEWVKNRLKKPELCEKCNKRKAYDLANKSGQYKRDLSDWEWLCRRCHMEIDGRLKKNLFRNKKIRVKKICQVCGNEYKVILSQKDKSRFCCRKCFAIEFKKKKYWEHLLYYTK